MGLRVRVEDEGLGFCLELKVSGSGSREQDSRLIQGAGIKPYTLKKPGL